MKKTWILWLTLVGTAGCSIVSEYRLKTAIRDHARLAPTIHLGAEQNQVIPLLEQAQASLEPQARRTQEEMLKDGDRISIYFARSGWVQDGLTTDDEFTPYIFENGKLVAIGWQALGGPRTVGQIIPPATQQNVTIEQKRH